MLMLATYVSIRGVGEKQPYVLLQCHVIKNYHSNITVLINFPI